MLKCIGLNNEKLFSSCSSPSEVMAHAACWRSHRTEILLLMLALAHSLDGAITPRQNTSAPMYTGRISFGFMVLAILFVK